MARTDEDLHRDERTFEAALDAANAAYRLLPPDVPEDVLQAALRVAAHLVARVERIQAELDRLHAEAAI